MPNIARAIPTGISGNSGKQGTTCNDLSTCHSGGATPVVRFEGPEVVDAGALATFHFVVESQSTRQTIAGFNVAASDGVLEPLEDSERIEVGELTHVAPKLNMEGLASWTFTWHAPTEAGPQTLFGAGLSANGNGSRNGDDSATATFAVTVAPAARPGDANCDGRVAAADLTAAVELLPEGALGTCALADTDCDGMVSDSDVEVLLTRLFDPTVATPCSNE